MLLIDAGVDNYPAEGTVFSDSIAAGVVAMVDEENKVLTSATSNIATASKYEHVRFVQSQGAGQPLIMSAPVKRSTVAAYGKRYAAATQQISYIGYTGSGSGNLVLPAVGESIIVRNTFNTMFTQFSDKLMESIVGYKVTAADTIATVATKLTNAAIIDVQRYVNIPYLVERISNGTVASLAGTTAYKNATVIKNSTLVTYQTAHGLSVGDVVTLNGVRYFVSTVPSTTTINLDIAYQGTSGVIVASSATTPHTVSVTNGSTTATLSANHGITVGSKVFITIAGVILSGTAAASAAITLDVPYAGTTAATAAITGNGSVTTITLWGIRFTGVPQKKFQEGVFRYETSKWTTTVQNFATTIVTDKAVSPTEGIGTYEQVAEEEWFFQLLEGAFDQNTIQIPPVTWRKNVSTSGTYSIVDLEWSDVAGGTDILHNPVNFKQLRLAVNLATRVTGNKLDDICDAIETWAPSTAAIVPTT